MNIPTIEQVIELWNKSNDEQKFMLLLLIGINHNDNQKIKTIKKNLVLDFYHQFQKEVVILLQTSDEVKRMKDEADNHYYKGELNKYKENRNSSFLKNNPEYQILVF